jgi:hypothetical protein
MRRRFEPAASSHGFGPANPSFSRGLAEFCSAGLANLEGAPMNKADISSGVQMAPAALMFLVGIAMLSCLLPAAGYAHGVVGDRVFLSPIVGNDAFPDNALDLSVRRSDYEFSLLSALEKQLSDHSSLLITGGWNDVESKPDVTGARTSQSTFDSRPIYRSPMS